MLDLTLHEIKNFLVLAETLHFGKASKRCHLSASALTRSVQRIEESIGEPLFIRDNRSVSLTKAGEKFRVFASQTLQEWETLKDEISASDSVSGHMSIYASVTAVYSLLPDLLQSYRETYPDVQIDLRTGSAEESVRQVIDGDIDLSVAALPDQQPKGIEFLPLTETNLVFVDARPSVGKSDNPLDLSETPLVLPRAGLSRHRLDQWLKQREITPIISAEVSGNEGILAMVRLGSGVGLVPELVLERSPFREEVRKIQSAPKLKPYVVGLCTRQKNLKRANISALWKLGSEHLYDTK
ncbi:MAG: HTH-type transcriptional activator IlvY [Akkermansiaceae bacterium]